MKAHSLLVLDDDREVVDFLCESLSEKGYATRGVSSPLEALQLVKRERFDMVITDVEMPEMRGTELLAAILTEKPEQLVLLITAFGSIDLAVSAVKAGACDFVTKPFKIEALELAIDRAFRDRRMRREIVRLRTALGAAQPGRLVAKSAAMKKAIETAQRAAKSDSTVLLTGETGAGKSELARFIHDESARKDKPFFRLNCAAIPGALLESELFGVKKGAFTDAREDRDGAFAAAGAGTLLLDEVGELPLELQAKLLHVLESGRVRRLGSNKEVPVEARIMAATNQPLEELLRDGRFRPDLYYRLNVIRIAVPPLRERRDDIVAMVDLFLGRANERHGRAIVGVSAGAVKQLVGYAWPGNVRELANLVERAVAMTDHDTITVEDLDFPVVAPVIGSGSTLEDVERAYVKQVVDAQAGNKAAAARILGINRRTLYRKLEG